MTQQTAVDWLEHYEFYLDNLQNNQIPLSFYARLKFCGYVNDIKF